MNILKEIKNSISINNNYFNVAQLCFAICGVSISTISLLFLDRVHKNIEQMTDERSIVEDLERKPRPFFTDRKDRKINFLVPNEYPVQPHLENIKPGWIVSTGAERSLFNLILAPNQCEGVIVRDVDESVKNYIDCIVLLLRVSENRIEFVNLVQKLLFSKEEVREELVTLQDKVRISTIPEGMKEYYIQNFLTEQTRIESLRKAIISSQRVANYTTNGSLLWSTYPQFKEVNYHCDDGMFNKLQKYAKQGRILATVGDISDLGFLSKLKISVIDASNICDYTPLEIDVAGNPRVIWTQGTNTNETRYYSGKLDPLNYEEKNELKGLLERIAMARDAIVCMNSCRINLDSYPEHMNVERILDLRSQCNTMKQINPLNRTLPFPSYSQDTLQILRKYESENIVSFSGGFIDFGGSLIKLNELTELQLRQCIEDPKTARFVSKIAHVRNLFCWPMIKPHLFFSFMPILGWEDAFKSQFDEFGYVQLDGTSLHLVEILNTLKISNDFDKTSMEEFMNRIIKQFPPKRLIPDTSQ